MGNRTADERMKVTTRESTLSHGRAFMLVPLLVAMLVAALPATAHGDPLAKPASAIACEHLTAGNRLYRLREFEKAVEAYKAGAISEDAPVFHYNLAQCYRELGRYEEALDPATVRAVHTIDQVAWDADGDRRFELELPTPQLETEWLAAAAVVGASLRTTSTSGTDHEPFRARGFAAVGLTEEYVGGDTSPFRHTPGDTAASIAPYLDYVALASKLTAQVVMEEVAP